MSSAQHKRCLGCGYILDSLPENRCPECGRRFDPRDPRTYYPLGLPGEAFAQAAVVGACLAVPAAGFILLETVAKGLPPWLLAVASLSGLAGVSIAIVMLGASGWRLLRSRGLPEDRLALRRAFFISASVLIVAVIVVLLIRYRP
jgi:hypothetical protein